MQADLNLYKLKHFYLNKYIVSPIIGRKYFLSYSYTYKALWFRTYKVASRSINQHFIDNSKKDQYIYSSKVGYLPHMFKNYFKFAFVRNPMDKFISAWKQKVLMTNSFRFANDVHEKMKDLNYFLDWVESLDINNCDEHLQSQNSMIDLSNIDFVGRFESFEADFNHVAQQINLPKKTNLHSNKSLDLGVELSADNERRIRKLYEKDFELFYKDF